MKNIKNQKIVVIEASTYREAILTIVKANIIVGTEGGLIRVAATLGKKIVVLDAGSPF